MTQERLKQIQKKINAIKRKIHQLQELLPGSLSQQYNVCGTKGCRCKDPDHPIKHGPYYQLGYQIKNKHTTKFIPKEFAPHVKQKLATYGKLRKLVEQWSVLGLEHFVITMKMKKEKEKEKEKNQKR